MKEFGRTFAPNVIKVLLHLITHLYHLDCDTFTYEFYFLFLGFTTPQTLRDHMTTHFPEMKRFTCDTCQRSFNRLSYLKKHQLTVHEGVPSHVCKICAQPFQTAAELSKHISATHRNAENNPYTCDQCDGIFITPVILTSHKRAVHQGIRLYACELCDKSFKTLQNLKYHISGTHTGERTESCEFCGKTFIRPNDLIRHMQQVHQDTRSHACDKCEMSFVTGIISIAGNADGQI